MHTSIDIVEIIAAYIEEYSLLPEQGTVVVAVSGGADSLCLLHLLRNLCGPGKRYSATKLHVAHLNHQLRGEESRGDAETIAQLAASWKLAATIGSEDVAALARREHRSLEEAARTARYRFLREVAREQQAQAIAVAHHKDDQVETLILHWVRGGGIGSLIGLQPRQQDIIRPLLPITHTDTLAYCQQHSLTLLEDASNTDTRFLRNRIRHELLPLLEMINPGIRATLLRTADVIQVDAAWIEAQIDACWSEVVLSVQERSIQVRLDTLLAMPLSLQRHLLRRVTGMLRAGQSPLELRHYKLIEQLMQERYMTSAPTLHLPCQLRVTKEQNMLVFRCVERQEERKVATDLAQAPVEVALAVPGQVVIPGTPWMARAEVMPDDVTQRVRAALALAQDAQGDVWIEMWRMLPSTRLSVYIDAETLQGGLYVRTRRAGDRIRPLGMAYEKKVQDVLVDKHVVRAERSTLPLFFSALHCVWVAGVCIDERVRLTSETRRIVRLEIVPL